MSFPSMRLDGQVAIVTGGGTGLGRAGALAFAAAGADVAIAARHLERCEAVAAEIRATGRRAIAVPTDIVKAADCQALAERVTAELGRIDILFNNAGITSAKPFLELPEDEWRRIIDVNLNGTYLCTRAVAPQMVAQKSGRIINMGSVLSVRAAGNRSAYSASKAAVANLTRALAIELGPHGITVNAIGPTVIVTDLNRDLIQKQPQFYNEFLKRVPMGRFGQPEDIAGALVFLASPAASLVTGQILCIDGGYTAG